MTGAGTAGADGVEGVGVEADGAAGGAGGAAGAAGAAGARSGTTAPRVGEVDGVLDDAGEAGEDGEEGCGARREGGGVVVTPRTYPGRGRDGIWTRPAAQPPQALHRSAASISSVCSNADTPWSEDRPRA